MEHYRKAIAFLKFVGPRFDDHGLDVDVLPELVAYKRLLQETAKDIWRRRNPNRQRLPKKFEAGIALKFYGLQQGSAGIQLFREVPVGQAPLPLFDHELDEAALLLEDAIAAAGSDQAAPSELPRTTVSLFVNLGQNAAVRRMHNGVWWQSIYSGSLRSSGKGSHPNVGIANLFRCC
jgi:hypothetical protein